MFYFFAEQYLSKKQYSFYILFKACNGSKREAFLAGNIPKKIPIRAVLKTDINIELIVNFIGI